MNLLDYEAFQVASLYRDSPHFEHIHQVLQNPVSRSGQEWHCRVFFTATYIPRWLESRSKSKYNPNYQARMTEQLCGLKFPKELKSDSTDTAAAAWGSYHRRAHRTVTHLPELEVSAQLRCVTKHLLYCTFT